MKKSSVTSILALVILILASLACGSSNSGQKVGETGSEPNSAPAQVQIYKIGDVVQIDDSTIVLNSADVNNGILKANFTVENKGSSDMNISSMLSFYAKTDDGTKLEQEIMDCGNSFDGKVLPGDKLRGDICWNGASGTLKIYYEANVFGSGAVVWQVP